VTPSAARAALPARSRPPEAPARRRTPARYPRRVSGPVRAVARPSTAGAPPLALPGIPRGARRGLETPGLAVRTFDALNGISQSALLDRLIRSRVWIGLLAFLLIGLVAMQLLVLHLNTQIGGVLAREATLQRENAQLSIADSQDSAGSLVEPLAAAAGMTVVPPGSLHFLTASSSDFRAAASALRAPLGQEAPTAESSTSAAASAGEASSPATVPTGEASASRSASSGEASSSTSVSSGEASSPAARAGEAPSSTPPTSEVTSSATPAGATSSAGTGSSAVVSPTGGASTEAGASGAQAQGG
jgi:hypothetical protein